MRVDGGHTAMRVERCLLHSGSSVRVEDDHLSDVSGEDNVGCDYGEGRVVRVSGTPAVHGE